MFNLFVILHNPHSVSTDGALCQKSLDLHSEGKHNLHVCVVVYDVLARPNRGDPINRNVSVPH